MVPSLRPPRRATGHGINRCRGVGASMSRFAMGTSIWSSFQTSRRSLGTGLGSTGCNRRHGLEDMALIAAQQRAAIGQTGLRESQGASATIKSCPRATAMVIAAILMVAFFLLQSRIPLGTAVQIGADEGFEVAKATLCLHRHKLYSEVWNDQPPLFTWLVTQVLKHPTPAILATRAKSRSRSCWLPITA